VAISYRLLIQFSFSYFVVQLLNSQFQLSSLCCTPLYSTLSPFSWFSSFLQSTPLTESRHGPHRTENTGSPTVSRSVTTQLPSQECRCGPHRKHSFCCLNMSICPLPSTGHGADHTENTSRVLLASCMLWTLPSNVYASQYC
jgi:hypothetical protein